MCVHICMYVCDSVCVCACVCVCAYVYSIKNFTLFQLMELTVDDMYAECHSI